MAKIDINRSTTGVNLPASTSSQIWSKTLSNSAVMTAFPSIPLPGVGLSVPTVTGEAVANWVDETEEKPVSRPTVGSKNLKGYTLAVIVPFSNQFRRDATTLYNELVRRLPYALGRKFDRTVLGLDPVPGADFDTFATADESVVDGTDSAGLLADLSAVYLSLAGDGSETSTSYDISAWLAAPALFAKLFTATNGLGQQTFIPGGPGADSVGSIFGAPVNKISAQLPANQLGLAGQVDQAMWGNVEGIQVAISDQATLTDGATTINLWQRNMFAVRAEMEVGFRVKDMAAFRRLVSVVTP